MDVITAGESLATAGPTGPERVHRQHNNERFYDVKKRSKRNNRRPVEAVEDARTSAQPAGRGV